MSVNFAGTWYNQHDSRMTLQVTATGAVSGTYQTGVGLPDRQETFPVAGFAAGDLIAFTVNFGSHGSLTAWAGQHTRDGSGTERLDTMWYLARNVPDADEPQRLWGGIWSGADVFRRTPYAAAERPTGRTALPSHPVKLRDR